jgi:hypothetical protein
MITPPGDPALRGSRSSAARVLAGLVLVSLTVAASTLTGCSAEPSADTSPRATPEVASAVDGAPPSDLSPGDAAAGLPEAGAIGVGQAPDGGAADAAPAPRSRFECKAQGASAFRPFWVQVTALADGSVATKDWGATAKGLLGQNAMPTRQECDAARAAANDAHGVICSRTGLDGWKPTLYTGTSPGRADFGYLGGSSIMRFDDCLKATRESSTLGVCFWGGSAWYVSPIDREGVSKGPYPTIDACVAQTRSP